jgi:hypothetical protein
MAYQGGLRKWFKENWINTSTGKACGEGDSVQSTGKYCRPTNRVDSSTPKTVGEIKKSTLARKKAEKKKKSNSGPTPTKVKPLKRV